MLTDRGRRSRADRITRRLLPDPLPECERCGAPGTCRHHRDWDIDNNVIENLEVVCKRCHNEEHGHTERVMRLGAEWSREHALESSHCRRGHPWDEANTYWYHGLRFCRRCNTDQKMRKYYAKRK